jgi:hypothetical protein
MLFSLADSLKENHPLQCEDASADTRCIAPKWSKVRSRSVALQAWRCVIMFRVYLRTLHGSLAPSTLVSFSAAAQHSPSYSVEYVWSQGLLSIVGVQVLVLRRNHQYALQLMWQTGSQQITHDYHIRLFLVDYKRQTLPVSHSSTLHDLAGRPIPTSLWPPNTCIITTTLMDVHRASGTSSDYEMYVQMLTSADDKTPRLAVLAGQTSSACMPVLANPHSVCLGKLHLSIT